MKKKNLIGFFAFLTLFVTSASYSEPPPGVGAANHDSGPCYGQVVVGPPGTFTPILPGGLGVMFVITGEGKAVASNSKNGNLQLTCQGDTGIGELVEGMDFFGFPAEGTPVGTREACDSLEAAGFGSICRGNNNGAIIIGADFMGNSCFWDGRETLDWKSVRSPSGKTMTSCHFKD